MSAYDPLTPEQIQLWELYEESAEVADFLDEQYEKWQRDPQVAFEALTELGEMGAR